jgi:hypothetical protein
MIVILRNRQRVRKRQRRRNEQYRCNETVRRIFHRHGEPIKHFPYELFHSACAKAEGRLIFLPAPARAVVEEQWRQRQALWPSCAFVFHHDGARIRDLRGAWNKACAEAGLTGKIPNDLRRTCVRNLTRAGITESVAMRLTGHKTSDVFRRYDIVSEGDLREAAQRFGDAFGPRPVTSLVTNDGGEACEQEEKPLTHWI